MRITSGIAKGHIIRMPAGNEIRPTLDIARKAIFDIIGMEIETCHFLDLFAGTGANGIEALSRGSQSATFVDSSSYCIKAIKGNLEKTNLSERAIIFHEDVFEYLESIKRGKKIVEYRFDVAFADPPYAKSKISQKKRIKDRFPERNELHPAKKTLHTLSTDNILSTNAVVIIEHPADLDMPDKNGFLTIWKSRRYGSTHISIYRKQV